MLQHSLMRLVSHQMILWRRLRDLKPHGARVAWLCSAERVHSLWDDLAKDASNAFDAIGLLSASGEPAVSLLQSRLKPAPAPAESKPIAASSYAAGCGRLS